MFFPEKFLHRLPLQFNKHHVLWLWRFTFPFYSTPVLIFHLKKLFRRSKQDVCSDVFQYFTPQLLFFFCFSQFLHPLLWCLCTYFHFKDFCVSLESHDSFILTLHACHIFRAANPHGDLQWRKPFDVIPLSSKVVMRCWSRWEYFIQLTIIS